MCSHLCMAGATRYHIVDISTTWSNARDRCSSLGLQLAVVTNEANSQALTTHLTSTSRGRSWWIGATDSHADGIFRWVDGSQVGFTHWGGGQPHDTGNEDCIAVMRQDAFRWHDFGCASTTSAFVCSHLSPPLPPSSPIPPSAPPLPPLSPPAALPPTRTSHYLLSTSLTSPDPGPLPWANARSACEALGMELAVARTPSDLSNLLTRLRASADARQHYWIGMARREGEMESFAWVDGSRPRLDDRQWAPGKPAQSPTAGCVEMYPSEWRWNNVRCDGPRAFVCSTTWAAAPAGPPMRSLPPSSAALGGDAQAASPPAADGDRTITIIACVVAATGAILALVLLALKFGRRSERCRALCRWVALMRRSARAPRHQQHPPAMKPVVMSHHGEAGVGHVQTPPHAPKPAAAIELHVEDAV